MNNLYGLIGEKLGHSISPKIHGLILNKLNLKGDYKLLEIERNNLKVLFENLKDKGIKGANVTLPYKIDIMKYLDNISIEAYKIGAINTIAFNKGITTGYNTDYYGFYESLNRANINVKNKCAVILGTGGASKAVTQCLLDNEIKDIVFVSRDAENKDIKYFNVVDYDSIKDIKDKDIIINCTPCGMYPKVKNSPVNKKILSDFFIAIDLIYNPKETIFLRLAKNMGMKTVNGLYMLVAQAIASEEIWHGMKISKDITKEVYEKVKADV